MNEKLKLMQFMIDGGIRAGILDNDIRKRTITSFLDVNHLTNTLGIPNSTTIY